MVQQVYKRLKGVRLQRQNALVAGCALSVAALCVVIALFLPKLNQPAEGRIMPAAAHSSADDTAPRYLDTPYYSTEYTAAFRLLPPVAHSASLDARMLVGRPEGSYGASSYIAITVAKQLAGGVTADSSYLLYKTHPETYTLGSQTIDGDSVTVVTRTASGYEKVYLWPHGSLLLTIDMTAGMKSDTLDANLQTILQHLQWKQQ